jgi:hypothetical protein
MRFWNRSRWISIALAMGLIAIGCSETGEQETAAVSAGEEAADHADTAPPEDPGSKDPRQFSGSNSMWNHDQPVGEPVAKLGDTPAWTETTMGAANKGTTGQPHTVVGEVVDVSCYLQLGKRGEAHIPCGTNCVQNGAPVGIVDDQNSLYILMAEEHDPRRYGNVSLEEALLPYMAKTVQVTGMLTDRDGVKTLYVLGYTMGDNPNQPGGE